MTIFEFARIEDELSPLFPAVWGIYQESFPLEEQRSISMQRAAWEDPGYEFLAIIREGEVIGLLGVWHLEGVLFMEHFALSHSVRGSGIGSSLLKEYLATVPDEMVVLEIDPLVDEISRRRAEFYKRLGFHLTEHHHVQFPFRAEDSPLLLRIMSYPGYMSDAQYEEFNRQYVDRVMNFKLL